MNFSHTLHLTAFFPEWQNDLSMTSREQLFRRQITGLLVIAAVIFAIALARSSFHGIFPPGWWRFR